MSSAQYTESIQNSSPTNEWIAMLNSSLPRDWWGSKLTTNNFSWEQPTSIAHKWWHWSYKNSWNQKEFSIIFYLLTPLPQSPFLIHLSNVNLELHSSVSQKQIASPFSAPFLQSQNWSGPLVWKMLSAWSGNAQP